MKVTLVFLLSLVGLWVQIFPSAALPSSRNQSSVEDYFVARALQRKANDYENVMNFYEGKYPANSYNWYSWPEFVSSYIDPVATMSDDDMRQIVRAGYDSSRAEYDKMRNENSGQQKPGLEMEGADLVATLFVPGQGYISASKPKKSVFMRNTSIALVSDKPGCTAVAIGAL